ncbi:MAG: hypothetical protein ACK5L5_04230 [Bacteroidales bacterium]
MKVSKEVAEMAVSEFIKARNEKKSAEAVMKEAEATVEQYAMENNGAFVNGRLVLGSAIVQIKAGTAKPMKDGKPLSTAARAQLATELPQPFAKLSCDFGALYQCNDKSVRAILKANGVEVVKDDKYAIV